MGTVWTVRVSCSNGPTVEAPSRADDPAPLYHSIRSWTLAYGHHEDRSPIYGCEPTRERRDGSIRQKLAAGVTAMRSAICRSCSAQAWLYGSTTISA
jgi:hypothetical protein